MFWDNPSNTALLRLRWWWRHNIHTSLSESLSGVVVQTRISSECLHLSKNRIIGIIDDGFLYINNTDVLINEWGFSRLMFFLRRRQVSFFTLHVFVGARPVRRTDEQSKGQLVVLFHSNNEGEDEISLCTRELGPMKNGSLDSPSYVLRARSTMRRELWLWIRTRAARTVVNLRVRGREQATSRSAWCRDEPCLRSMPVGNVAIKWVSSEYKAASTLASP